MADLYGNKKTTQGMMEPIALQGRHLTIHYLDADPRYRVIDFYEPIAPHQTIDIAVAIGAALAAQTASARTNLVNLELPDDELGQYRWYVIDNAQIRLFLPSGVQRGALLNLQVPYDASTPLRDPNLVSTEIFVWENNRPAMEAINFNDYALDAIRIVVMGYRFHTIKSTAKPDTTHVWCTGRGQG